MLSKKTQYAFKALIYLTEQTGKGPILISEISQKKNIPLIIKISTTITTI